MLAIAAAQVDEAWVTTGSETEHASRRRMPTRPVDALRVSGQAIGKSWDPRVVRSAQFHRWLSAVVAPGVLVGLLSACTANESADSVSPSRSTASASSSSADPTSSFTAEREIRGQSARGSLWSLFYHHRVGDPVKSLWRMTGTGTFTVTAIGPDGRRLKPTIGPEAHDSSSWHHPGDEWGVFWVIPAPGRWAFHVKRSGGNIGAVSVDFR